MVLELSDKAEKCYQIPYENVNYLFSTRFIPTFVESYPVFIILSVVHLLTFKPVTCRIIFHEKGNKIHQAKLPLFKDRFLCFLY